MPTIFADTNNGTLFNSNQSSHANARDATTSNSINTTSTSLTANLYQRAAARGGGVTYRVDRIFLYFDTSTITSTPASATFSIQRTSTSPLGNFRIIKSNAFGGDGQTALAKSDFDAFPGFSAGNGMSGNVTDYCDDTIAASAWGTGNAYNTTAINLNSTALSDMASNDFFILAIVNFDFDYKNVDSDPLFITQRLSHYTPDFSGTSRDPKIDFVTAGYGNDVIGVASADIGEVNAVATANIAEINGL